MTDFPDLKLKALISFPATVYSGSGIDVVKANGSYTFNLAFSDFAPPVGALSDPAHQNVLFWNDITGQYVLIPASVFVSASPGNANPIMDGVAASGASTLYSRQDHVHPNDTSRAPLASPTFTGDPKAPTPTAGDNDTSIATTQFVTTAVTTATVSPATVAPLMNGVAAVGVATKYAREDHIHASDTSRAATVHAHVASDVTDFAEATDDRVSALLTAGTNVTLTYNDPSNTLTIDAAATVGVKNYIVNGAMMVSQENGSTAGSTSAYYPVDEFLVGFAGTTGTYTTAQVASVTPGGSPNRLRVTVGTADAAVATGDIVYIQTSVEGLRAADLMFGTATARTVTLRFGVRVSTNAAGTYCVVLLNSATNRSYVVNYSVSANTDTVITATIVGDTTGTWLKDNGRGISVRWGLMAGATFQQTAGSWGTTNAVGSSSQFNLMATSANVFELFDVAFTVGTVAPAYQVPEYSSELMTCQRYFQTYTSGIIGCAITTAIAAYGVTFAPKMRAAPTVGAANPIFTIYQLSSNSAFTNTAGGWSFDNATVSGCEFQVGGFTGLTIGSTQILRSASVPMMFIARQ